MTVVVADARSGKMVSDSRVTLDEIWIEAAKIYKHKGELLATAGNVRQGDEWLDWYKAGKKGEPPKKLDDFQALVLRKDGVYVLQGDTNEILVERCFHAIGSGSAAALGAMLQGATCEEAVTIACLVDYQCGGTIRVESLKKET